VETPPVDDESGSNPTDDNDVAILEDTGDNPTRQELRHQIAATQPPGPPPAPFPRAEAKDGPARFRSPGEPVARRWDQIPIGIAADSPVSLSPGPGIWLRLMPVFDPGKRWAPYELRERAVRTGSLDLHPFVVSGIYPLRAEDGVGICSLVTPDARETSSVAFAFATGEVWSIDCQSAAKFDPVSACKIDPDGRRFRLVPVANRRVPRASRSAPTSDAASRVGVPVCPPGQAGVALRRGA